MASKVIDEQAENLRDIVSAGLAPYQLTEGLLDDLTIIVHSAYLTGYADGVDGHETIYTVPNIVH